MYITETTEEVRNLMRDVELQSDLTKMKFLIYVFNLVNNNQINNKNEANPDLIEDDTIEIFTLTILGMSENACTIFLQYLVMLYNILTSTKEAYEENGNVLGIKYTKEESNLLSKFEKLDFLEKLDILSELFIRYDNDTYFDKKITNLTFDSKSDGYALAKKVRDYKNSFNK